MVPQTAEVPVALVGANDMVGEGPSSNFSQARLHPQQNQKFPCEDQAYHPNHLQDVWVKMSSQTKAADTCVSETAAAADKFLAAGIYKATIHALTSTRTAGASAVQAKAQAQSLRTEGKSMALFDLCGKGGGSISARCKSLVGISRGARGTQTVETIRATG